MNAANSGLGSARVSRAGDGVAQWRIFLETQLQDGAHYSRRRLPHFEKPWATYAVTRGSSFRRDAETSTRDACAIRGATHEG